MDPRLSRADRADAVAAAIGRFERGETTGDHDGRLIAENLGIEAGFGGSVASRRQQAQQYFARFPELRQRWRTAVNDANTRAGRPRRDLQAELAAARAEAGRLREQLASMDRIADLWRRKAERVERQLEQQRRRHAQAHDMSSPLDNVVALPNRGPSSTRSST